METGKDREAPSWMFLTLSSQVSEGIESHQEQNLKHLLEKQDLPWEGQLGLKWQQELTTDRTQGPP